MPSDQIVSVPARVIPRDRIKLISVMKSVPEEMRRDRIGATHALRREMLEQIGAAIAESLIKHDKVWFSETDGAYFASVEVIIPDPSYGPVGAPLDAFWIGRPNR